MTEFDLLSRIESVLRLTTHQCEGEGGSHIELQMKLATIQEGEFVNFGMFFNTRVDYS